MDGAGQDTACFCIPADAADFELFFVVIAISQQAPKHGPDYGSIEMVECSYKGNVAASMGQQKGISFKQFRQQYWAKSIAPFLI